jgi:hypothetical protein
MDAGQKTRMAPPNGGGARAVGSSTDQSTRGAAIRELRQILRWRYFGEPWTRRVCCVPCCGRNIGLQLHHSTYSQPPRTEHWAVMPMCDMHHRMFEFELWPAVRNVMPRYLATQNWIVHGEPLLEWEDWWVPITVPDTFPDQLALWDGAP